MKRAVVKFLKEYNIVLILVAIFCAALLWVPYFAYPNNLKTLLLDISMYGIMAVGVSFVLISGEVDLSVGVGVSMATICCAMLGSQFGALAGIAAALLAPLVMSSVVSFLTIKVRMSSLIASIAVMTAMKGICYMLGEGATIPLTEPFIRSLYGLKLFGLQWLPLHTLIFVLVLIAGAFILRRTRFGLSVYVAGGNPEAGYTSGISIGKVKLLCFLICGLLTGIFALFLTSFVYCGAVSYGDGVNLTMISACVLGGVKFTGGKGGILQTFLGISVIRIIVNICSLLSLSAWAQNTITGALLIIVLIIDRYNRTQREEDIV